MTVRVLRVRDSPEADGGTRVLVDRLWPRGVAKADAPHDEWLKDVAPSSELRKWYGHDPERTEEFGRRYRAELAEGPSAEALDRLRTLAAAGTLTLVTATRDLEISHARVLVELIDDADG